MDEFKWLIGLAVTVTGIVSGLVATAWRVLSDRQYTGDNALHERINRVREELGRDFVRKSDLDGHLQRIDKSLVEMREEGREAQRETNRRLDAIISAVKGTGK
jgi:hypothetical protein